MKKVAIIGPIGSGKSTIGLELGQTISFAAALKAELAQALSSEAVSPYELMIDMKENKDQYRELLQAWGQFRRNQDEDYWVNKFKYLLALLEATSTDGYLVCDDCRYPNEYAYLLSQGFTMVRINAENTVKTTHESESYWPHFPVSITVNYEKDGQELMAAIIHKQMGMLTGGS